MSEHRTLYAYYDLGLSPISFDFAVFAISAEIERRKRSCTHIHFVIVPGDIEGFRNDDAAYDVTNKRWRLANIVLPICQMLPSPTSLTTCRTRKEASTFENDGASDTFPPAYSTANPSARFGWAEIISAVVREVPAPSLTASQQALGYMQQWLDERVSGRKPITITLRESSHLPPRNSNVDEWLKFAHSVDNKKFVPIVIRDTEKAFEKYDDRFDGLIDGSIAAVNLDLRMALYEHAWINLMNLNGPAELCRLNEKTRYLIFNLLVPEVDNTSPLYMASQGFKVGGQLPHASKFQRQVWEEDKFEIIAREFHALDSILNTESLEPAFLDQSELNEDPIDIAVRLQMTGRLEEAADIFRDIVSKEPEHADAWHMMGIIAHQTGQIDAAEKLLSRAISIDSKRPNFLVSIAAVYRAQDRLEEARNALLNSISLNPTDPGAHAELSEILSMSGDEINAENELMEALKLSPSSIELYEQAAKLLEKNNKPTEALQFYRRAVELKQSQRKAITEAQTKMPEIPHITLASG